MPSYLLPVMRSHICSLPGQWQGQVAWQQTHSPEQDVPSHHVTHTVSITPRSAAGTQEQQDLLYEEDDND
ncbi:hypothetical protein A6R68_05280 [Neotoma lepida]|uniref:Uncharacterized protein n=1 Tax=Neotoma lepida TaxID=56216 RepID=A0A1A6GIZ1_NEOLE|nr:hypothetical protein A6R68_05280 [Neotoma lepida]